MKSIDFDKFIRLIRMVDRAYLEDLNSLKKRTDLYNLDDTIKSNLYQAGFLNQSIKDNRDHEQYVFEATGSSDIYPPTFEYKLNYYGKTLIVFGF